MAASTPGSGDDVTALAPRVPIVADGLAARDRAGRLGIDDPLHAAWQFLCMLKAEKSRYAAFCVAMFLRADSA